MSGDPAGWPLVLAHEFPYDPHCYDEVASRLAARGADVIVPWLRGYGPSRYRDARGIRSGQQAALAGDLRELIVGLGLVTVAGYNVHDIAAMSTPPNPPADESRNWYQRYLHSERGRAGLARYRREFARQLWQEWSPGWAFADAAFEATATSFDNPDFVDTVVHSYRHRYGLAAGDPDYESDERVIARQPEITVPTVVVDAADDPLEAPRPRSVHGQKFPALVDYRGLASGHNVPQENPVGFADAVLVLREHTRG